MQGEKGLLLNHRKQVFLAHHQQFIAIDLDGLAAVLAEKPDQGEVLAVGPGKRNDKGDFVVPNVKTGDRVLFGKYSGQTVKVDGDELLVMKEDDLFAVVEK